MDASYLAHKAESVHAAPVLLQQFRAHHVLAEASSYVGITSRLHAGAGSWLMLALTNTSLPLVRLKSSL